MTPPESKREGDTNPSDSPADEQQLARTVEEVRRLLLRRVTNREDAKDLVHEALAALLRTPRAGQTNFGGYLATTALHLASELHAQKRRSVVDFDSEAAADASERLDGAARDIAEMLMNEEYLEAVLREVPETYREILVMSDGDGLTPKEIADRLNMEIGTIRKYITRGRAYAERAQAKLMDETAKAKAGK